MLPHWLRAVRRRFLPVTASTRPGRPAPRRARLSATPLEDRLAPSVTVFQQNVDNGFGAYTGTLDTDIRQNAANTAGSTRATVLIDWPDNNNEAQALIRFNSLFGAGPGQIPLGARIVSAKLTVNTTNLGDGGEFHRMLVDWTNAATWNNTGSGTNGFNGTPGIQADGVEAAVAFESFGGISTVADDAYDVPLGRIDIDVTRDLRAWSGGAANFGWAMLGWNGGTDGWEFNQSENATASSRPQLTVEWLPAATSTATFQQGVGGYTGTKDTWLQQNATDANNSATPVIFVDGASAGGGDEHHVLLRFDSIFGAGAGQIPVGSTILGATLRLDTTGSTNSPGDGGHFHRMLTPWADTATWDSLVNGVQPNDAEAVSVYDAAAGNPSATPNQYNYSPIINVTADLQAWSNGQANNGWAILPWVGGSDGWGFRTSEAPTVGQRPELVVYYGPAPAAPPVNNTLDVVGGTAIYTGGSTAQNNAVTLSLAGGNYTIADTGGPITLTAAATAAGWVLAGNSATGPDANTNGLTFDLNLGNDTFALQGINDPLTVTAGGHAGDVATLPVSLTYAGTVSMTGFNTVSQTAGTVQTIPTLTLGGNTVGTAANPIRTTATTVNVLGGSGGAFLTETDGASVTFRAGGSGAVAIATLAGTLTVAGTSFGGSGPLTLTSPDAVAVNAPITTNGTVAITANTDGAGTEGFTQAAGAAIVAGNASATAITVTVNTPAGGTGVAAFGAGVISAPGGTITINANAGTITGTTASLVNSGTADVGTVVLNAAGIGTATTLFRTSTGHILATGGDGGVFVSEHSSEPGFARATATGPGNIHILSADAGNNGLIIDGPVWTQTGNITIQADDNLRLLAPVGGLRNGLTFGGTVLIEASRDLVNEQFFVQEEDALSGQNLGYNGTITTTNTTAAAVTINVSATTTAAGTGGGAILGHITVGNGGTITVNAQAGTRADRTGRILMTPGGLLDAGPTGTVILQARNNSIGEAPFLASSPTNPILVTAGRVIATTNSVDPSTSLSPFQAPGDIYVTSTGPATFAATTTSAPGYTTDLGFPVGTDADLVLTTLSGALTIAPGTIGTTTVNTRTDSGSIVLRGANGIVLNGAIGGAGETGGVFLYAGGGTVTQPGGSVVTTGGLMVSGAGNTTLGQTANDLVTVAANVTGTFSIADANAVATGTVTPPAALNDGMTGVTGITATGTTVTGGRLNVMTGANVVGPATAAAAGTLGGNGTVTGALTAQASGTVSPGTGTGILNVGATTFAAGSTFAVELNGTTVGTQYDQLNVTGAVNLGGATLAVTQGFAGAIGNTFTIINNDAADAVVGTFANLAQGAFVSAGGQFFTISYTGGTGNDVVLTRAAAPAPAPTVANVVVNGGGAQRSEVRSVVVSFSEVVNFVGGNAASAFTLSRVGGGGNVGLAASVATVGTQTVVTLTFTNANAAVIDAVSATGAVQPSLADGVYRLGIADGAVTSAASGQALDGDGNSSAGGAYLSPQDTAGSGAGRFFGLYRLFGDATGNGLVDLADLAEFRGAFNQTSPNAAYLAYLDADNSGTVDLADLSEFRSRFNQNLFTP